MINIAVNPFCRFFVKSGQRIFLYQLDEKKSAAVRIYSFRQQQIWVYFIDYIIVHRNYHVEQIIKTEMSPICCLEHYVDKES